MQAQLESSFWPIAWTWPKYGLLRKFSTSKLAMCSKCLASILTEHLLERGTDSTVLYGSSQALCWLSHCYQQRQLCSLPSWCHLVCLHCSIKSDFYSIPVNYLSGSMLQVDGRPCTSAFAGSDQDDGTYACWMDWTAWCETDAFRGTHEWLGCQKASLMSRWLFSFGVTRGLFCFDC